MTESVEQSHVRIGNRYLLEERVGAGAMGAVWRGTDELLNRTVAVKELLAIVPGSAGDTLEQSRERLLREGRLGARLQHPHVISMFDVVLHDDRPWLVMEYLPSRSLAAVLAERDPSDPLGPRDVADIGRQVADGLAAAHAAGVVHRDVKPGNVLLGADGMVKLTDFGVSRAVDDVQVTRTGLIAGTPAYLAPEVARGSEPSAAADVFALGATLYAAVEGRPPFGIDENAYALLHKVATGEVNPPRQAGPLTAVIMRLLAVDAADRPSAEQARDALAAIAAGRQAPSLGPPAGGTAVFDTRGSAGSARGGAGPGTRGSAGFGVRGNSGRGFGARAEPVRAVSAVPLYGGAGDAPVGPGAGSDFGSVPRNVGPSTMEAMPPVGRPARRAGRPALLLVLLAVLLVVGAVTAFALTRGSDPGTGTAAAPTSAAPAPTRTRPPATPAPNPAPVVGDPVQFVQDYYALLPDKSDTAFELLGPIAQAKSQGRDGYEKFWDNVRSVAVTNAQAQGNTVTATIVFEEKNGKTSNEPYSFVIGEDNGRPIIESFQKG